MSDTHIYEWKTLYIIEDWEVSAKAKWKKEVSIWMEFLKQEVWDNVLLIMTRYQLWADAVALILDSSRTVDGRNVPIICDVVRELNVWEIVDELLAENIVVEDRVKN